MFIDSKCAIVFCGCRLNGRAVGDQEMLHDSVNQYIGNLKVTVKITLPNYDIIFCKKGNSGACGLF